MAFNKNPTAWFPNIVQLNSDGSGNITGAENNTKYLLLQIHDSGADFEEIKEEDLDEFGGTADVRKMLFGLLKEVYETWDGTATADRPNQWSASISVGTSTNSDTIGRVFTHRFNNTILDEEVKAE